MYRLIKPDSSHEQAYLEFIREWTDRNENIVPYSARLDGRGYTAFLMLQKDREDRSKIPAEFVVSSFYLFMEGNAIVGAVSIRHELNERLLMTGGHIGYGIRPTRRGEGLAKIMLSLALDKVRNLGIQEVLMTCYRDNLRSARTIQACGGVKENEVLLDGKWEERYWITLE
ncbi:MAG: GNAT family N-acetyltransferase [Bacillus subtilis]|nr:GNAT family N-acetyltransferase [Bacillus subtilis]